MIRYIFFKCSKDDSMIFQISKIFKELFSKDRMTYFQKFKWDLILRPIFQTLIQINPFQSKGPKIQSLVF